MSMIKLIQGLHGEENSKNNDRKLNINFKTILKNIFKEFVKSFRFKFQ